MVSCPTDAVRSEYLVNRLLGQPRNLYGTVKFRLVAEEIRRYALRTGKPSPRVLDVGCADKVALRYFADERLRVDYCGVDLEQSFGPDVVGDARELEAQAARLPWRPDVILLLDVLENLDGRYADIRRALRGARSVLAADGIVLVAVPQMYRLDRLKLSHLYYPEHKVRFTLDEWLELLGQELDIDSTQGVGYLSVLPYLTMLAPVYRDRNALGRAFELLRGKVFEWGPLKGADTWLSNTVGRVKGLDGWANDVLIVCRR